MSQVEGLVPPGIDNMPKKREREEVLQYLFGLIVDFYINIVSGSEDDEKSNCNDETSKDDRSNMGEKDIDNTTKNEQE